MKNIHVTNWWHNLPSNKRTEIIKEYYGKHLSSNKASEFFYALDDNDRTNIYNKYGKGL